MAAFSAVVLALITFWLHRRLVRATRMPAPWSSVTDVALLLLWVLAVVGAASGSLLDPRWVRAPAFVGMTWLAVIFYLFLGLSVIGLVSFAVRIVRRLGRAEPNESFDRRRLTAMRIATALVVVVSLGTVAYGLVEAARPRVVDVDITLPRLPSQFDGMRIAVISDLHVGPSRGAAFTQRVVDQVNAQRPDLIVIAGDLLDGTIHYVADDLKPLADLSAPLGVFGISGNHEFYADDGGRWLDVWDRLGIHTLRNQRVTIERGGAAIDLAGIQDYTAPDPYEPDLPAALAGRDPNRFVLLLAHQPRQAIEASDLGVDLQISGHTHGGQMWPIRYLVTLQQPSLQGLDRVGNTVLYTTRGAGAWGPPVRVAAPPEITLIKTMSG
ncbi:metallophosphoesterase [Gordonia sp. NPDC003585]|uniref:metallophosphoesterase n=1 Tax=unclassified Gordonia (in: high G+C Gram-positive bacteria) TaxID=2657482 RepID=UPI0033B68315